MISVYFSVLLNIWYFLLVCRLVVKVSLLLLYSRLVCYCGIVFCKVLFSVWYNVGLVVRCLLYGGL